MRKKEIKIPMIPITEETFIRQGWQKIEASDGFDDNGNANVEAYYYVLNLPKHRDDEFCPILISNSTD